VAYPNPLAIVLDVSGEPLPTLWGWLPDRSDCLPDQFYAPSMLRDVAEGHCAWCKKKLMRSFAQSDQYPGWAACWGCDTLWQIHHMDA
jgi:hypothetical protein